VEEVCKYSGMQARTCGQTREIPFLEGTVPPLDNMHSKGCLDVVQGVRQDDRRPDEWVESAKQWADRLVNGQLGAVGDATELKEHPNYRLAIAPVLGNTGFGSICGERRATPKPSATPRGSNKPSPGSSGDESCPPGNREKCSPLPSLPLAPSATSPGTSAGVLVPAAALSLIAWLIPLVARAAGRRRR
jgi:hypothetical protein